MKLTNTIILSTPTILFLVMIGCIDARAECLRSERDVSAASADSHPMYSVRGGRKCSTERTVPHDGIVNTTYKRDRRIQIAGPAMVDEKQNTATSSADMPLPRDRIGNPYITPEQGKALADLLLPLNGYTNEEVVAIAKGMLLELEIYEKEHQKP